MAKKLTQKEVEKIFIDGGCELLCEYTGALDKLRYRCSCGNIATIKYSHFKDGHRCKECGGNLPPSQKYIEQYFLDNGCRLLSLYKNSKTKLKYLCSCGNVSYILWNSFKAGHRCKVCGIEKTTSSTRLSFFYVKKYFSDNGCTLLENEYKNSSKKMNYICKCGNTSKVSFEKFKIGRRCAKCSESLGERKIDEFLKLKNILYIREYRFDRCRYKYPLPFDFAIVDELESVMGLIEFDGEQHFNKRDFFGGNGAFEKLKKNDNIKNEFCKKNGIPLLRISYKEFNSVEAIVSIFLNKIK